MCVCVAHRTQKPMPPPTQLPAYQSQRDRGEARHSEQSNCNSPKRTYPTLLSLCVAVSVSVSVPPWCVFTKVCIGALFDFDNQFSNSAKALRNFILIKC